MALACACGEEQVATGESKYVHVGASKGAYQQVTELKYVGEGKGDIEKKAQTITKPGVPWVFCASFRLAKAFMLVSGVFLVS